MLFSSRVRVEIGFSVSWVSCYAHVFVLVLIVVVTLPRCHAFVLCVCSVDRSVSELRSRVHVRHMLRPAARVSALPRWNRPENSPCSAARGRRQRPRRRRFGICRRHWAVKHRLRTLFQIIWDWMRLNRTRIPRSSVIRCWWCVNATACPLRQKLKVLNGSFVFFAEIEIKTRPPCHPPGNNLLELLPYYQTLLTVLYVGWKLIFKMSCVFHLQNDLTLCQMAVWQLQPKVAQILRNNLPTRH